MSTLAKLQFVETIPTNSAKNGLTPLERAKLKLLQEIDNQIKLAKNPDFSIRKVVNKRDGSTATTERKPRSWVAYSDDSAFITVRISNKPVKIGGIKGSVVRCKIGEIVETLEILKRWARSEESDELIRQSLQNSRRKKRSGA